jgi:hypothetical protein
MNKNRSKLWYVPNTFDFEISPNEPTYKLKME